MIRRLLLRVAAAGCSSLPPEWGAAARAELDELAGTVELVRWTASLLRLALPPARVLAALVAAATALAWADQRIEPAAGSLVLLVTLAAVAGALTRRPVASGAIVGASIAAAHLALVLSGRAVAGGHPSTALGSLTLLVLLVPALLAAFAGAYLGRR